MRKLVVTSTLDSSYREAVEDLVYFNPQQTRFRSHIVRSLERYGTPEVCTGNEFLRIRTDHYPDAQTLYALDEEGASPALAGVVVFVRESEESIAIVQVAVHEDYASTGGYADEMLVMRLVTAVREAAARIRGVQRVSLAYASGRVAHLPVC
jgi:hypothetical protein